MTSSTTRSVTIDLDADAPKADVVDADRPLPLAGAEDGVVDEDVDPLDRLPAHAVTNADGSVTLALKFPQVLQIKKNGKVREDSYGELTFHRLNGGDQRAIAAASDEMTAVVAFARSTRISQAVMNALFDRMDAADINAAGQVLNSFLSTGRRTGRSS